MPRRPIGAYLKLDDKNRNLVRSLCQKNGVTLEKKKRASGLGPGLGSEKEVDQRLQGISLHPDEARDTGHA